MNLMNENIEAVQAIVETIKEETERLQNILKYILNEAFNNPNDSLSDIANEALIKNGISEWYFNSDFEIIYI